MTILLQLERLLKTTTMLWLILNVMKNMKAIVAAYNAKYQKTSAELEEERRLLKEEKAMAFAMKIWKKEARNPSVLKGKEFTSGYLHTSEEREEHLQVEIIKGKLLDMIPWEVRKDLVYWKTPVYELGFWIYSPEIKLSKAYRLEEVKGISTGDVYAALEGCTPIEANEIIASLWKA